MPAELDERKQKVLKAIIQDYLETAEPVGSRHLSRKYKLGVSPATIRNEMYDLEEEGYIKQPHTSAGRVPSDKGYRYYVDNLMKMKSLSLKEEEQIRNIYNKKMGDLELLVHQTLSTASILTHYATMMTVAGGRRPERVYHFGISNIASQPEFSDIDHLKSILKIFDEDRLLTSLLREYSEGEGVNVKIGSENKFREVKDCSVVVTSYCTQGKELGSIGIIGPTRMFYNKAITTIDQIANKLGEFMSHDDLGEI